MAHRRANGHDTDDRPDHLGHRRPVRAALVVVLPVALLLATVFTASPAAAAVTLGLTASFPAASTVGQAAQPATITIQNRSTAPDVGPVILGTVTLVPSCGTVVASGDCPAAAVDPGVFQLSPAATGEGGTACAGVPFAITIVDPAQGKVQFATPTFVAPIVLGAGGTGADTCRIDFSFKTLKLPTKDAAEAGAGMQTSHLLAASGVRQNGGPGGGVASSLTTVTGTEPTLVAQATPSAALGSTLSDTVTLAAGTPATGSITFKTFGPADAACTAAPVSVSIKPVTGPGSYTSDSFTPTVVGTYNFIASYDNGGHGTPVTTNCSDAAQISTVSRAAPTISITASPPSGGRISDSASLTGAVNPSGTFEFRAYGPNDDNCSGVAVSTVTQPTSVTGTASSVFSPTAPGTYRLVAAYSGDANNKAVSTGCNDTKVVVAPAAAKQVPPPQKAKANRWRRPAAIAAAGALLLIVLAALLATFRRRPRAAVDAAAPPPAAGPFGPPEAATAVMPVAVMPVDLPPPPFPPPFPLPPPPFPPPPPPAPVLPVERQPAEVVPPPAPPPVERQPAEVVPPPAPPPVERRPAEVVPPPAPPPVERRPVDVVQSATPSLIDIRRAEVPPPTAPAPAPAVEGPDSDGNPVIAAAAPDDDRAVAGTPQEPAVADDLTVAVQPNIAETPSDVPDTAEVDVVLPVAAHTATGPAAEEAVEAVPVGAAVPNEAGPAAEEARPAVPVADAAQADHRPPAPTEKVDAGLVYRWLASSNNDDVEPAAPADVVAEPESDQRHATPPPPETLRAPVWTAPPPAPDGSILPSGRSSPDRIRRALKGKAAAPVVAGSAVVAYLLRRSRKGRG